LISDPPATTASDCGLLVEPTLPLCAPACWGATAAGGLDAWPPPGAGAFADPPELLGVPAADDGAAAAVDWSAVEGPLGLRLAACGATVVVSALWVPSVDGPAI
jgi:hypothetical protein